MMNNVVCHNASTLASGFLNKTRPCTSVDVSCAADGHPVTHPKALLHPIQIVSDGRQLLSYPLPTNEIAKPFLQRLWCEFRHPMVLPTRSRCPKLNPIHQPLVIPHASEAHMSHLHGSHLRNRRNHTQRPHNNPNSHPNHARRAPINEPVLRREQDTLPRRLQHHHETDDGNEAETSPKLLPFAHSVHVVDIVSGAAFLLPQCGFIVGIRVWSGVDLDLRF